MQDVPDYAPGTQKKVTGEVIRWNNVSGAEKIDAVKYIEMLEAEIEELNRQIGRTTASGQNELLEYLKSLEPQNLKVMEVSVLPYFHFLQIKFCATEVDSSAFISVYTKCNHLQKSQNCSFLPLRSFCGLQSDDIPDTGDTGIDK